LIGEADATRTFVVETTMVVTALALMDLVVTALMILD